MLASIDPFVDAVADESSGCACSSSNIAHMLSICTNKCSRDTGGKLPETFWSTFGNRASAPKVPMAPKHVSEKNMTCRCENIAGACSSVVLSFEDPDGSIAQQLLKTPIFAFGAPASVKPWLAKPTSSFRSSVPTAPHSLMDVS
jgi:hypothetical protein